MTKMRLLLVDDHPIFREGLMSLLASSDLAEEVEVVGQASDGLQALEKAKELHPDIVLMDIEMPVCNGLEATRLIRAELPDTRIAMLTVHDDDRSLFEAVKRGAIGFLPKRITAQELAERLRALARGEPALCPDLAVRILDEFAQLAQQQPSALGPEMENLTFREKEVLQKVAEGATNRQIAEAFSLSEYTVKNHLRNILRKLHVRSRIQAAERAVRAGLVRAPPPVAERHD